MNRKIIIVILSVAFTAGIAFTVSADVKPEILVKQRRAGMTLIGKYFGPLVAMARGKTPFNAEMAERNASYLEVLSRMPWDGFQETTMHEKSEALPLIYKDTAKFKTGADDMQKAMVKLVNASKTRNAAAVISEIELVDKGCSWCHDKFREKKD